MRGIIFVLVSAFVFFCSANASRDVPARKRLGPFPPNNPPRALRPRSDLRPPPPLRARPQQHPLFRSNPFEGQQAVRRRPQPPVQKRVLVLPTISEGYASTSFQGGAGRRNGVGHVATEVLDATPIYNNDIAANFPVKSTTETTTTTRTTTTTASTTTTSRVQSEEAIREQQLRKSEDQRLKLHLQELENLKAQRKKDTFSVQVTSSLGGATRNVRPRPPGIRGSVEEVSLFAESYPKRRMTTARTTTATTTTTAASTTTTAATTKPTDTPSPFVLQPGDEKLEFGKTEDEVLLNPDEYVRFIASPPKQINIAIPSNGQSGPPVVSSPAKEDSLIYKPGFHQQVSADPTSQTVLGAYNHEPKGWPISQDDTIKQDNEGNFYPLGKPPPKHENRLPGPPGINRKPIRRPGVPFPKPTVPKPKRKTRPTSIFDFLIPSFLSGGYDEEKEEAVPVPSSQSKEQIHPLKKLPVPTRPPNTFPQPEALGGRLNPIRIKVPSGFQPNGPPRSAFPKPPTLEDWQRHQQSTLSHRSNQVLFQRGADPRINRLGHAAPQDDRYHDLPLNPPQPTKLANQNRAAAFAAESPVAMTGQPIARPLGAPASQRKQATPFAGRRPSGVASQRKPTPRIEKGPWTEALAPSSDNRIHLAPPSERESIKAKLKDPAFVRNLTQAYVYHDEDSSNGLGEGGVTYVIPNANPFAIKPESKRPPSFGLREINGFQSRIAKVSDDEVSDIPEIFDPEDNVVYKPIGTRKPRPAPTTTTPAKRELPSKGKVLLKKYLANPEISPSQAYDLKSNSVPSSPSDFLDYLEESKGAGGSHGLVVGDEEQLRDLILNDDSFATYLTHLDDSLLGSLASGAHNTVLSSAVGPSQPEVSTVSLDRVFEPSMSPSKSDWFILNEKGQRERPMSEVEIADARKLVEEHSTVSNGGSQQPVTLSGGFFPISGLAAAKEQPITS